MVNISKNLNKFGIVGFFEQNNPIFKAIPINAEMAIIKNNPNSILGISREHECYA